MNTRKLAAIQTIALAAIGIALLFSLQAVHAAAEQQDAASFSRGAKSWAQNCARCHNMRDAKEFRDDQWKIIVSHMRVRAGLTGQEARDILLFLQKNN